MNETTTLNQDPTEEELQAFNAYLTEEEEEDSYVRHMDHMMAELGCNWDDPRLLEA